MTLIIGLTGGIGSGKSVASDWFAQQGVHIVDTDIIAREVVEQGQPALTQIRHSFGDWAILENGELNRRALRDYIFQHPTARTELENITHPLIRQRMLNQLQQGSHSPYTMLVSPLLFEKEQHLFTHRTLLIDVDEQTQLERVSHRDQQSLEQIKKIIAIQMPRSKKQTLADDIILNNGSLNELYQQLEQIHQVYLTLAK